MNTLWLDRETWNELDLKIVGGALYAESAEDLLVAYAINDDEPQVWDVTEDPYCPWDLQAALEDEDCTVIAHNAWFDRMVHKGVRQLHLPQVRLERWQCTMAIALSHALPGGLADLCKVLGVPSDMAKIKDGKRLLALFTRPLPANRKIRRATRLTHPEDWQKFKLYAANDISAMRECFKRMPKWNWDQSAIDEWHLDQRINERGFQVDTELTAAGMAAAETEKLRIGVRFRELTGGAVDRPSLRAQFLAYLNDRFGLQLEDTQGETFQRLIDEGGIDPVAVELMRLSMSANKTSTAKYARLAPMVQSDGRFRGALQFSGAGRTRRWAGRGPQYHNLPARGLPPTAEVSRYVEHLKNQTHDLFFEDLMKFGAAALRHTVVAEPGRVICAADLSNIEGRKLSWFAQEEWKLQAFRDFDAGTGPDLYKITAASMLGGSPWDVSKKNRNVFGKVPDLACLGGDTLVETSTGIKPMHSVQTTDLVWDGGHWVTHKGLVDRGVRPTICVDGITATPDHLFLVQGFWVEAHNLFDGGVNAGSQRVFDLQDAGPNHRFQVCGGSQTHIVHNSGYQGGVAGYQTFGRVYGVLFEDYWGTIQQMIESEYVEQAWVNLNKWGREQQETMEISEIEWVASETCKLKWRSRHPKTRAFWYNLQDAAKNAILNPGGIFRVAPYLTLKCVKHQDQTWLVVKLPSGRYLTYFEPHLQRDGTICYWGEATEEGKTTRQWIRCFTHGGKMTGNVCQTSARDTLASGMAKAESRGYPLILTVHDEAIASIVKSPDINVKGLVAILAENDPWNIGLPLSADGFEAAHYLKED